MHESTPLMTYGEYSRITIKFALLLKAFEEIKLRNKLVIVKLLA